MTAVTGRDVVIRFWRYINLLVCMYVCMSNIGQNLFVNKKALQVFCEIESVLQVMVRRTACQKEINDMTMMTC